MSARQAGDTDHVHLPVERQRGRFLRRLEQGAAHHLEAHVAESGGDDVGPAIMSVLPQLGDEHARLAPEPPPDRLDPLHHAAPARFALIGCAVDAVDRARHRVMAPKCFLHGRADLAERGAGAGRLDGESEQIAFQTPFGLSEVEAFA